MREEAHEPLEGQHRGVEIQLHQVVKQPAVVLSDQLFENLLIYQGADHVAVEVEGEDSF